MKAKLEKIKLGVEKSIHAFKYESKNFETPWHFHPQHELTYIEESSGTKFIGDYVGSYEPGELVLVRSNLPHCWKNVVNDKYKAKSIVIQWNPGLYPRIPELVKLFEMLKSASHGIKFKTKDSADIIPKMRAMQRLKGHKSYLQLLEILTTLSNKLYKELSKASFTDQFPTEYGTRIAKIHKFVEHHYHEKIYLSNVSKLVYMSEQSFSRFFSKAMGRPFFTFLNEYRINMACRMLIDSDLSVAQIGYTCGYESLPFFHRQFNKFNKVTPKHYRKYFVKSQDED